jgi:hypothetical protein
MVLRTGPYVVQKQVQRISFGRSCTRLSFFHDLLLPRNSFRGVETSHPAYVKQRPQKCIHLPLWTSQHAPAFFGKPVFGQRRSPRHIIIPPSLETVALTLTIKARYPALSYIWACDKIAWSVRPIWGNGHPRGQLQKQMDQRCSQAEY